MSDNGDDNDIYHSVLLYPGDDSDIALLSD
jgi:hypothetical protein